MNKFGIHVTLCMPVGLLFINEGNRTAILHGGVCAAQLNARLPPTEVVLAAAAAATEKFVVSCGLQERVTHLVSSSIFKEGPSELDGQWGNRPTRFIKELKQNFLIYKVLYVF